MIAWVNTGKMCDVLTDYGGDCMCLHVLACVGMCWHVFTYDRMGKYG